MKKAVVVTSALLLLVGAGMLYRWAQTPSVSKLQQNDVKGAVSTDKSTVLVTNDYFSVALPTKYVLKSQNKGTGLPLLLQQLYAVPVKSLASIASDQLAITVKNNEGQQLKDMSDVLLRARSTDYQEVAIGGVPGSVVVYESSKNGYELGAFVLHDSVYASFVLTSTTSSKQEQQNEVRAMLQAIAWQ